MRTCVADDSQWVDMAVSFHVFRCSGVLRSAFVRCSSDIIRELRGLKPLHDCRIVNSISGLGEKDQAIYRNDCASGHDGHVWLSGQRIRKHLDEHLFADNASDDVRRLPRLPWLACLSAACYAVAPQERLDLLWKHFVNASDELPIPRAFSTTVGLVIRTYAGSMRHLQWLFRSIDMFWPHWRWPVTVIFDAESAEDQVLATLAFPRYVNVFFEPPPKPFQSDMLQKYWSKQFPRAARTFFLFDKYTSTEYIAQIDADVVLLYFCSEEALFDDDGRPRISGLVSPQNAISMKAVGLQPGLSFMVDQPYVLHRSHLQTFASS